MYFDDSLHEGKPYACALAFCIQLFEEAKDAFVIFWRDAYAIVFYEEDRSTVLRARLPNLDARVGLIAHVFRRVIEQVLQNFDQARFIPIDSRQVRLDLNRDVTLLKSASHHLERFVQ